MKSVLKHTLQVVLIVAAMLALFDLRISWQHEMPDDGQVVCSLTGKGFVVSNGVTGVFLRRRSDLDNTCASHMK